MKQIFLNYSNDRKVYLLVIIAMLMIIPCSIKQNIKNQLSLPATTDIAKEKPACSILDVQKLQKNKFQNKVISFSPDILHPQKNNYNDNSFTLNSISDLIKWDKITIYLYLCVLII